jgi:hypothetical protein
MNKRNLNKLKSEASAVAISLGCSMPQHEDSNSGSTSFKVIKNVNKIKPSFVKV